MEKMVLIKKVEVYSVFGFESVDFNNAAEVGAELIAYGLIDDFTISGDSQNKETLKEIVDFIAKHPELVKQYIK